MRDFQRDAGDQGRLFDQQCRLILRGLGFDLEDKGHVVEELGVEVDAVATNRQGVTFWFEFKGSWLGSRPGSRRTDTVKKALLTGLLGYVAPEDYPPFVLLTSHLPKLDSRSEQMLVVARESGALADVICVNDPESMGRLERLAEAQ